MTMRRSKNEGKREREAGKRHRRGSISYHDEAAGWVTLKLGHRHMRRLFHRQALAVAESEKRTNGAPETP